jgi:prolyl-tRNA synthetase
MQDGKALQAGTSHFLGQNFARAFDVKFQDQNGKLEYAWATSWGVSTRLIGGLIMTHSDDQGLVLPPRLAPIHAVIVPIYKTAEEKTVVLEAANKLAQSIRDLPLREWLNYEPVTVRVDNREQYQPGFKFNEWELKGVPVRVELGPKDLAKGACVLARRDLPGKEAKEMGMPLERAAARVGEMLQAMQTALFDRARKFRDENTHEVDSYDDFKKRIEEPGGFFLAHWDGTRATEDRIAAETKATIRCIPFDRKKEAGKCMVTGQPSEGRVVFAKAY